MGVETRLGGRGELERGVRRREDEPRGFLKAGEVVESGRWREEEEEEEGRYMGCREESC